MQPGIIMRRAVFCLAALMFGGCTMAQSQVVRLGLKLPPAALGEAVSLQQHLTVEREERIEELDVALEIDAEHLAMVGLVFGQRVLTMNYDGATLTSWRHFLLPKRVRSEDILEDIQLTYWPVEVIRQALPDGWRIEDTERSRTLFLDGTPVMVINYSGQPRWNGTVELSNLRYGYRLTILSSPSAP